MPPTETAELPAWVRELDMALPVYPQILLVGNVRDRYMLPDDSGHEPAMVPRRLADVIALACDRRGYAALVVHDLVQGGSVAWPLGNAAPELPAELVELFRQPAGDLTDEDQRAAAAARLRQVLVATVTHRGTPVGCLFPYTTRLASQLDELSAEGKSFFAAAEALGHTAHPVPGRHGGTVYNTVFWVAERQEELPAEFATGSHALRIITIPSAPQEQRLATARHAVGMLTRSSVPTPPPDALAAAAAQLADASHGMRNAEVDAIVRMAQDQRIPLDRMEDAARLYRTGVIDNPWATGNLRKSILKAEDYLNSLVLGQGDAVRKTVGIFKRSAAGMTGAHAGSSPNRPRGVLFMAGPTGVGKTELAKGIASLIFGKDARPVRFDMSEFAKEHAIDRLIGAPPGYVGHQAGGELTKAVRQNPMSVLLFDEIEKADPRLFDLFLQVLEDGRLTDGRGMTAFFTDTVLVFTSNLGIVEKTPGGMARARFSYRDDPAEVRRVLRHSYEQFFDVTIGRPELRNRLGDSFVVMDFIQPETVPAILAKALDNVIGRVALVHDAELVIGDDAREALRQAAVANLDHGGRGIGNAVDVALVDPLAGELFTTPPKPGEVITVTRVSPVNDERWEIEVRRCCA